MIRVLFWCEGFVANCKVMKEVCTSSSRLQLEEVESTEKTLIHWCSSNTSNLRSRSWRTPRIHQPPAPFLTVIHFWPTQDLVSWWETQEGVAGIHYQPSDYPTHKISLLPSVGPSTPCWLPTCQTNSFAGNPAPDLPSSWSQTTDPRRHKELYYLPQNLRSYIYSGYGPTTIHRIKPGAPLSIVWADFARPLQLRRGNLHKPTIVKAYVCLFVCLKTKAAHLELIGDLTTAAIIASLRRFTARRERPTQLLTWQWDEFRWCTSGVGGDPMTTGGEDLIWPDRPLPCDPSHTSQGVHLTLVEFGRLEKKNEVPPLQDVGSYTLTFEELNIIII